MTLATKPDQVNQRGINKSICKVNNWITRRGKCVSTATWMIAASTALVRSILGSESGPTESQGSHVGRRGHAGSGCIGTALLPCLRFLPALIWSGLTGSASAVSTCPHDQKSGIFQLERRALRDPVRIDRLLLMVAIAVLISHLQGYAVSLAGERRRGDPHWKRRLEHCAHRSALAAAERDDRRACPFSLDPDPTAGDPWFRSKADHQPPARRPPSVVMVLSRLPESVGDLAATGTVDAHRLPRGRERQPGLNSSGQPTGGPIATG